ncbi:P-loop containing nucleoside triphosphate hydrolase protein [Lactarius pseudohatsudake]|nr:P-loop containing nucleoside triphosphate hydrolase protein [Lactarius pseudohatsudake]
MSRSTGSFHPRHASIPKGLAALEWFKPELLKYLDDEGIDVALESIQQFVRSDTLSFVFEVAWNYGDAQSYSYLSRLCLFRLESLSEILKRNYIPAAVVDAAVEDNGALANRLVRDIEILEEVPAAYPQVQPMKAALYFDSVDGFGQWRILISGRADRNLREMRKKDTNLFRITLKKIKELSNGHFSDDNHKRLTGTSISVPIYEAKMTRDSRLVYQVDCVPDFNSQVECQAIKVFGVYTHAQLDKRLWDSMGHQLSRKGKEYQRRATPDAKMIPDELPIVSDEVLGEELAVDSLTRVIDLKNSSHSPSAAHEYVSFRNEEVVKYILRLVLGLRVCVTPYPSSSPHEQEIIENAHSCFVQGRSGTGKTTTMLFKMLGMENSWQQNRELRPNRPRQLFVTQSRMLADKVEEYFIKLLQSLVLASKTEGGISDLLERQKNREEAGLVDQDEAMNWREDLPQRFSDLQDAHFPMFITFDKLSAMIEADMSHPPGIVTEDELGAGQQAESSEYMLQRRKSFISSTFFGGVLGALSSVSNEGHSEFMGVIKGSEMTLDSETHFLDYETYLNLSARTQATFAGRRKEIYVLFETYLKMKRDRREYDAADRTHAILRSMVQDGMKGQKIDFLYVDEVQDNLLIDAKEPSAAIQTERMKQQFVQTIAPHQPRSFQLVTNFRSHGGIVRCAHSVIVLITKFWPYAIDILPEEKGIVDGIKPVFFSGWDQDNVRYESFLFGTAGHHIEFGAQQCILVRNDAAREKLRKQVGNIGLIMTLYESKGLEFNDVLLYNFFEDSTVDVSQWRVVLNAIDRAQRAKIPAPTFDESRHAGVCSELKFLYVAITRARKNLWVVDRSETAEPMRIYWSSNDLFQNCTPGADVPQLAVSSSPEEWAKMARTLFSHKRYFQAMHSYERAGMLREKAIAHAYHLREQARGIPVRNRSGDNKRRDAHTEVARAFLASAREATIFRERSEYYRIAAEAFLVLEDHAQAAQAFEKASKFTEAGQNYRRAGMFDATVSVIQNHGDAMDSSVASQLTDVARYYYLQRGDLKCVPFRHFPATARHISSQESLWLLFSGLEEELEFVRDCDLDIAEVNILVEAGRFREAAVLHIRENRVLDAVEVLLKDKNSREATQLATQKLLDALWSTLSFGVTPDILDGDAQAKLRKIKQLIERLDVQSLDSKAQQEFQMFEAM